MRSRSCFSRSLTLPKRLLVWLGFVVAAHSAVSSWWIWLTVKPHQRTAETWLIVGGLSVLALALNALLAKHFFSKRTTLPYGLRVAVSLGVTAAVAAGVLAFYWVFSLIESRLVMG